MSSKRTYPNWLTAYQTYSHDNFCPSQFHLWTGISVLAGALERKVQLRQGKVFHTPNLYVMLVSHPAVGKSTAMNAGTELLERLKQEYNPDFRIIPNQVTEPAFLDLMKIIDRYQIAGLPDLMPHSSGFFYASEASSSALQNVCGDFVATLTAFYDCPKWFRKKLKMEKESVEIENGCMNILAGSTFDYLKTLVNETSVMGGFASRLIYVIAKERKIRETKWDQQQELDGEMARRLTQDLAEINRLTGNFKPTAGFKSRVEEFQPEFDRYLIDLNSSRMESINARKGTHIIKLSMILSVSEGSDLIVDSHHFDRAKEMIDAVTKDNAFIIGSAVMSDKTSQEGLNQTIAQHIKKLGGRMSMKVLKSFLMGAGYETGMVRETLDAMFASDWIRMDGSATVVLLIEPDAYL